MAVPDREPVPASDGDDHDEHHLTEAPGRPPGERKVVASRELTLEGANVDLPHLATRDGRRGHPRECGSGTVGFPRQDDAARIHPLRDHHAPRHLVKNPGHAGAAWPD
jgi:hypothetical protein